MTTNLVGAAVRLKDNVNATGVIRAVAYDGDPSGHESWFVLLIECDGGELKMIGYDDVILTERAQ